MGGGDLRAPSCVLYVALCRVGGRDKRACLSMCVRARRILIFHVPQKLKPMSLKRSGLSDHPGVPRVQETEGEPGKESDGNWGGMEKREKKWREAMKTIF